MRVIGKMNLGLGPCSVESFDQDSGIVKTWDPISAQLVRAKFNGYCVAFVELDKDDGQQFGIEWSCIQTGQDGVRRGVIVVPDLEILGVWETPSEALAKGAD